MLKYVATLVVTLGLVTGAVADEKPYKEGPVTSVTFVRVKDGKFFEYMTYLGASYRQQMEALKKAGLVLDYKIYRATPQSPQEANLILTVVYPNYAALDHNAEFDAVATKTQGSLKAADEGFGTRDSMREVLGSNLVQELTLK
jgi:hypothetical protein